MYRYEIVQKEDGYEVNIYDDDVLMAIQPFDPETGQRFVDEDSAKNWAESFIALMIPPEVEEEPTEEGTEPAETVDTTETTDTTTTEDTTTTTTDTTTTDSTSDTTSDTTTTTTDTTTTDTTTDNTSDTTTTG